MRRGYTTGTCAQAAAKAAVDMFVNNRLLNSIEVETPSGVRLKLGLVDCRIGNGFARCAVVKDSGDDPDTTNGIRIYAQVNLSDEQGIVIKAGKGIGKVTKPGLAVKVGEPAINPVPRSMILKEVSKFLPQTKGLQVTISVPEGEALASRTFNPKLGIVGGISIIGTTGIVEPRSEEAYKASLALELDVLKAEGRKEAVFVLGYVGERYCNSGIKIGDHVGFMVQQCAQKGIKKCLLIGHIGKLIKVASGQFNTHYKFGDNRLNSIAKYAQDYGAKKDIVEEILKQATAEAAIDILRKNRLMNIFENIAQDVSIKLEGLVRGEVKIDCIILSLGGEVLGEGPHCRDGSGR